VGEQTSIARSGGKGNHDYFKNSELDVLIASFADRLVQNKIEIETKNDLTIPMIENFSIVLMALPVLT